MSKKNVEWEWKKLKDICEKGSSSIKQGDLKKITGDYPIYGASGFIQNVDFYQQDKEYIGIVKDGSGVGRTMFLPAYSSVIGTLQYILPKEGNSIKFVNYALQNIDFSKLIQGAAIPHIYFKDYGEMDIAVPPLDEQERIVKVLDDAFEKIDAIKTTAETNLQNAKDLFQTEIENTFTIGNTEYKPLESICNVINGYAFPSKDFSQNNPIKSIKITNVGVGEFVDNDSERLPQSYLSKCPEMTINNGDLVVALTRTLIAGGLKIAFVPPKFDKALLNQRVAALRPKAGITHPVFIFNYFRTNFAYRYVANHVNMLMQPNLSISDLKKFPVPSPSFEKQKQIVAKLDSLSEKVKQLESNYKQVLADCDELKKSILKKAFNGEL